MVPIDVFNICRFVDNISPNNHSVFVPFKSQTEWTSFIAYAPIAHAPTPDVTLATCARPDLTTDTTQTIPADNNPSSPFYSAAYFCNNASPAVQFLPQPLPYARTGWTYTEPAVAFLCTAASGGEWVEQAVATFTAGVSPDGIAGPYNAATSGWVLTNVAYSGAPIGQCGSANLVATSSAPTSGLCAVGTASVVSGSGPWTWSCSSNGNLSSAVQCSAPSSTGGAAPVGMCGTANGQTFATAPTTNLCAPGSFVANFTGADTNGPWLWQCNSSATGFKDGSGTTTACEAFTSVIPTCTYAAVGSVTQTNVPASPSQDYEASQNDWTAGPCVMAGESVTVAATGTWNYGVNFWPYVDPTGNFLDGSRWATAQCQIFPQIFPVLQSANCGALIAKVGVNGTPFAVNKGSTFIAPTSGYVYYIFNDYDFSNNAGSLYVTATIGTATSTPPAPGVCGSASGTLVNSAPTSNLCSSGTASAVQKIFVECPG